MFRASGQGSVFPDGFVLVWSGLGFFEGSEDVVRWCTGTETLNWITLDSAVMQKDCVL